MFLRGRETVRGADSPTVDGFPCPSSIHRPSRQAGKARPTRSAVHSAVCDPPSAVHGLRSISPGVLIAPSPPPSSHPADRLALDRHPERSGCAPSAPAHRDRQHTHSPRHILCYSPFFSLPFASLSFTDRRAGQECIACARCGPIRSELPPEGTLRPFTICTFRSF